MPFLLLLVVTVACMPGPWPGPADWAGTGGALALTWAGPALLVALAGLIARSLRRQLARHPDKRSAVLRRYRSWRTYHLFGLLGLYLLSLFALGWVHLVRQGLVSSGNFPGIELLILAPFLIPLILSWALFYSLERDAHPGGAAPFPGRWSYVGVQTRHNLILVCLPLLLMFLQQILLLFFPQETDWLFRLLSLVVVIGVFITLPWILRLYLGLKPLPPGPIRDRLLATSRRLGIRCNDIFLWDTRQRIANAMVTGLLPCLRYVVLTDRLLQEMTPDEIEAVFGHELGHARHHHMLYYLAFLLISTVVVMGVWEAAASVVALRPVQDVLAWVPGLGALELGEIGSTLLFLLVLGLYIFVVFGFLSRRCERQADIFGCRAVSCGRTVCAGHEEGAALAPAGRGLCSTGIRFFIGALEKVADLNGISRDRPGWLSSWQHSTIARRVDFLQQMSLDPAVEPRFQRRVGLVKWGLLLCLGAAFGMAILVLVWTGVGLDKVWNNLQTF